MADIPDEIPWDEIESQQQALTPVATPQGTPQEEALKAIQAQTDAPDEIPWDEIESDEDKYGSMGQQALTAVEGAAEGIAGPVAPFLQTELLGQDPDAILGRRNTNPVTHGVGQAVGLGAGLLTGTGEAALMTKAGQLATEGAGLAKAVTYGQRVGAAVVREAIENAVLQGSDEVSKLILNDPDTSAESAIGNIGLAAAIGGAGGAFFTGAAAPLWNATAGPKIDGMLSSLKNHLDGKAVILPEAAANAARTLEVDLDPVMRAAIGGGEGAQDTFTTLQYAQNPKTMAAVEKLQQDASESVAKGLGIDLEGAKNYDKADVGNEYRKSFFKEVDDKYAPVMEEMERRNKMAETITLSDDRRMDLYGKLQEKTFNNPEHKLYQEWGDDILNYAEDVKGLDTLLTRIRNDIDDATSFAAPTRNKAAALKDIRKTIKDFREEEILRQSAQLEKEGSEHALAAGRDLVREHKQINQNYAKYANELDDILDHLGAGDFHGTGSMKRRLESISPETLVKKFSVKGDSELVDALKQAGFGNTLEQIRQQELKGYVKSAITNVKGEMPIDFSKLSKKINADSAGESKYLDFILPQGSRERIDAAQTLMDSLPKRRDSGTPGGLVRMFKDLPRNAMAAAAMMLGNNPITGMLIGEATQKLSRDIPDAVRLGYLKFLGSEQPVSAPGFRAMVEYFDAIRKADSAFNKGSKAVFKAGIKVLSTNQYPTDKDREKLDKRVSAMVEAPDTVAGKVAQGDVGYYLPDHQEALAKSTVTAVSYLQALKPRGQKTGPLDRELPPSQEAESRYNRALDIAQAPNIVFENIKDGTLQLSDIQDINGMFPGLYSKMQKQLTTDMIAAVDKGDHIPYVTKQSLSLFLGQPLESSMSPMSIQAAQLSLQPQIGNQAPQQGPKSKGSPSKLGKTDKSYMTPSQAAEADRAGRNQ